MRVKLLMLCALVVLIALPVTAGTIAVKGKVVDPGGKPVSGVKVFAMKETYHPDSRSYAVKAATLSKTDGSFSFALAPPAARELGWYDRYYFIAYAPGEWLGWCHGAGSLAPGDDWTGPEPDEYSITVSKLVTHEGEITDEKGRGMEGVALNLQHLLRPSYGVGLNLLQLRPVYRYPPTITDKDGRYRVSGVPDGVELGFEARKPGYVPLRHNKAPYHGVMKPAGSITGRVVDEHGKPMCGIRIEAFGGDLGYATTARDGAYTISELRPSEYSLTARITGSVVKGMSSVGVTAGKASLAQDIVVYKGVLVRGRVLDSRTGKPISGVEVVASDGSPPKGNWYSVAKRTGADGTYSARVLPGKFYLHLSYHESYELPLANGMPVTVGATGLRGTDLKLVKRKVIGGRILNPDGTPAADVMIKLFAGDGSMNAFATASTGPNGRFTLTLPREAKQRYTGSPEPDVAGTIMLEMKDRKWKYAAIYFLKYDQVAKGNLTLNLYPSHIASVKVLDRNGTPLPKTKVFLGADWQGYSNSADTDTNGAARFLNVFHGDTRSIHARLDGYYFAAGNLPLPAVGSAKWNDDVTVTMEDARRTQNGRVVDEQGTLMPGIRVYTGFGPETTTDDKGEFVLLNMPDQEVPVWTDSELCYGSAKASKSAKFVTIKVRKNVSQ